VRQAAGLAVLLGAAVDQLAARFAQPLPNDQAQMRRRVSADVGLSALLGFALCGDNGS